MKKTNMALLMAILFAVMVLLSSCSNNGEEDTSSFSSSSDSRESSEEKDEIVEDTGYYGALQVAGANLTDKNGKTVRLNGVSSHGLSYYPEYVNYDMLKQARDEWNCNVFRVAMYTEGTNGYCVGDDANREALKERIDTAVEAAEDLEMYVIIDWHILSDNNPLIYQEEAIAFFREMAEEYEDGEHVIYEICNEPNGGTTWEDVKAYASRVIPVIREYTDAVVLVGTPNWCQNIDEAAASPITGEKNIMYTLHYYAATHKDDLRQRMVSAVNAGLPVFVSEFGICDASGNGEIDEAEADLWLDVMIENNVSFVMWNLSNKEESSAMIQSHCTKTSGITVDELAPAGKWLVSRYNDRLGSHLPTDGESSGAHSESSSVTESSDGVSVQTKVEASWNENGKEVYKYVLTVANHSNANRSGWTIHVTFNQDISLENSWGGFYTVNGSALSITPEHYNNVIYAGAQESSIGFIVASGPGLEIVSAAVE